MIQEISFRPPKTEDTSFIMSSWLKSYRDSDFAKAVSNPCYFENHAKLIERLISKSLVIMAVNPEDEDQIYGYIVFEQSDDLTIIHYAYVKFPYRKFGIMRQLVEFAKPDKEAFGFCSHLPRNHDKLLPKFNIVFNPYLMA